MPDAAAAAEEEDDEEEEQEEDEAVEGFRGGRGGGGDEGVSPGTGLDRINGDELCDTNERLRAGSGGGTSHPRLSQPPPSAAPGRWIRLPLLLLPERPTPPPPPPTG